jgi:SAM-dependent methyltransferase
MPTLDPPPLQMEPPAHSFCGRTLDEYARFFALDLLALRRQAVLDVAAGSASFTAEASRRGIDAVAVDPCYDHPASVLAGQIRQDGGRMFAQRRAKPRSFRPPAFPSPAAAGRRSAAQWFLADYEGNARHGRYVRGALPLLPFLDGAFDLVLCGHLLFIQARRFDFDWHFAACAELMRVSGGEVRIHPLCGADGRRYAELERLRDGLLAQGVRSEVVPVDCGLFTGSDRMLVLTRHR